MEDISNKELIEKLYTSLQKGDAMGVSNCYHDSATFADPVFGRLNGKEVGAMWAMLLSKKESELKIEYFGISADDELGHTQWIAHYNYGVKKRPVVNKISSRFKFQNGKIIEQVDDFDIWTWSRQALGLMGLLMGWTPWMHKKIREMARKSLYSYMNDTN